MREIKYILAKMPQVSDRMDTELYWKYTGLLECFSGDCRSRRRAGTAQEQLWNLGMVLGSSVNRTLSAWNPSHLGWFLNPTRQNSCSLANTDLQQVWNTKQKFQGEANSFLCLPATEPLERQEKITWGTCLQSQKAAFHEITACSLGKMGWIF